MHRPKQIIPAAFAALMFAAAGCDYSSPSAPETSAPGPEGATIAITASGLTPGTVSIDAGESVTFTNNDTVAHEIVSTPVPTYSDCPAINLVGRLEPGESAQTGALTDPRSCGFLDLLRTSDSRWSGTITIQE
jgi:plastocyanin